MNFDRYIWLLLPAIVGCNYLRVTTVDSAARKPNNAWVFFSVEQSGNAVPGLTSNEMVIREDGHEIPQAVSLQTLESIDSVATFSTLLLIDGSDADPNRLEILAAAASSFVTRVTKKEHVGVYVFDGSKKLIPIFPFGQTTAPNVAGAFDALKNFKPRDASTNLYGAVTESLRELRTSLANDGRALKFGNLVVITSSIDRAARVSYREMDNELDDDRYENWDFYAVGLGKLGNDAPLSSIGKTAAFHDNGLEQTAPTLDAVAAKIEDRHDRFYLLSYCTPARGGEHSVRVDVHTPGEKPASGSSRYSFKAEGFGPPPVCDPLAPAILPPKPVAKHETKSDAKKPSENAPDNTNVLDWKPDSPSH